MRQISQAYACTCDFFTHTIFYLQLHAIFGTFYLRFLVNIYAGGTVYGSKHDVLAETKVYKFNLLYKSILNS